MAISAYISFQLSSTPTRVEVEGLEEKITRVRATAAPPLAADTIRRHSSYRADSRSLLRDLVCNLMQVSIFTERSPKSLFSQMASIVFLILLAVNPDAKFYRLYRNLQRL